MALVNGNTDAELVHVALVIRRLHGEAVIKGRQAYIGAKANIPSSAEHRPNTIIGFTYTPQPDANGSEAETSCQEKPRSERRIKSHAEVCGASAERDAVRIRSIPAACSDAEQHFVADCSTE